jgi:uncharacterized membrane protein YkoI
MQKNNKNKASTTNRLATRRQVLIRLGIASGLIYSTPTVYEISAAHASNASSASGGENSSASGGGESSGVSSGETSGASGGETSGTNGASGGGTSGVSGGTARKAQRRKEIRPLRSLIKSVETETGGRVISHKLKIVEKKYVYYFKIVSAKGVVDTIVVDASNAAILAFGAS